MLGTILSVMGGANTAFDFYRNVGALAKGDNTERVLASLDNIHEQIVQLNENIWYAPRLHSLTDTECDEPRIADPRVARELLDPLQQTLGEKIVSSGVIKIPSRMETALSANPWAVLVDIRPQQLALRPSNPDMVPVMFTHCGIRYIGWQMRGTLPMLFGCNFQELPGVAASSISTQSNANAPERGPVIAQRLRHGEAVSVRIPPPIDAERHEYILTKDVREPLEALAEVNAAHIKLEHEMIEHWKRGEREAYGANIEP